MNKIIFAFLMSVLFVVSHLNAGSCCGLGGALVSSGHPSVYQGNILILSGLDYSKNSAGDFSREGLSLGLAYGITDNFALSLRTNYSWFQNSVFRKGVFDTINNEIIVIKPDTTLQYDNNGISDGTFGAQLIILPITLLTKQELKTGIDMGIPWAESQKKIEVDGMSILMPAKIQTGLGAFSLGGFVAYTRNFPEQKIAASATMAGRLRFKDKKENDQGNEASVLVSAIAGPFWKTKEILSFSYRTIGKVRDKNGNADSLSGGARFDLTPAIEFSFTEKAKLSLDAEIPLWRDKNQIENGNAFSTRLSFLLFIRVFDRH